MPRQTLAAITFLVPDYDSAIAFFTGVLGFDLIEDSDLGEGKRWVLVAPHQSQACRLLLARATTPEQIQAIGMQTGGRVAFFLYTEDFATDYATYKAAGVQFVEDDPRDEPFGTVIVFEDPWGNKWDLIEPKA